MGSCSLAAASPPEPAVLPPPPPPPVTALPVPNPLTDAVLVGIDSANKPEGFRIKKGCFCLRARNAFKKLSGSKKNIWTVSHDYFRSAETFCSDVHKLK